MTLPASPARMSVGGSWRLRRRSFDEIQRPDWERLFAATPAATPFSTWTFHRAWWDAFAAGAEEQYLVLEEDPLAATEDVGQVDLAPATRSLRAIAPFMTRLHRGHSDRGAPTETRVLYFAASYHADYATVLTSATDLPVVAGHLAAYLVDQLRDGAVDLVDLRRMADDDPFSRLLETAVARAAVEHGLAVRLERDDVCPVLRLAPDWDAQLEAMDGKRRHELRRKLRRAERHGALRLRYLPLDAESAERLIVLHQARWGAAGLFARHEVGARGRVFLQRLTELEALQGAAARFHLAEVCVGDRPVYLTAGFAHRGTCYFYNAGLEPSALDLSPGVVGTAAYLRDRLERGDERFDFLRGDEAYKYDWGAVDRPLGRLVIERPERPLRP